MSEWLIVVLTVIVFLFCVYWCVWSIVREILPWPLQLVYNWIAPFMGLSRRRFLKLGEYSEIFCERCGSRLTLLENIYNQFDPQTGKRKAVISYHIDCTSCFNGHKQTVERDQFYPYSRKKKRKRSGGIILQQDKFETGVTMLGIYDMNDLLPKQEEKKG